MAFSSLVSVAGRSQLYRSGAIRRFSDASSSIIRKPVSMEERAANRAARKERATQFIAQARGTPMPEGGTAAGGASTATSTGRSVLATRWVWYLGVAVPAGLLFWGYNDENSPPARLSKSIGLTDYISSYTDHFAQPSHDKLLPDWSQVSVMMLNRSVYHGILLSFVSFHSPFILLQHMLK